MSQRSSLADVAREAGVHPSTASRALNPQTRSVVGALTVEKVLAAAERLDYRPNTLARGLRTDKTFTIGMVVPDLENPLFPPLVSGAERVLGEAGYSLLVGNTDNSARRAENIVGALIDQRVDGLILAIAELSGHVSGSTFSSATKTVLVNRRSADVDIPAILGDDDLGIGLAVDHLVELGHVAIGHVAGPSQLSTGVGRAQAFRKHMAGHGLLVDGRVRVSDWFGIEPGRVATEALLEAYPDTTAIVAGNDLIALGAIEAVRATGREIPADVSITGYNDMPFADRLQPPLTTVRVPYRRMGELAAETLLSLMGDQEGNVATMTLSPTLSVRSSTGPATP